MLSWYKLVGDQLPNTVHPERLKTPLKKEPIWWKVTGREPSLLIHREPHEIARLLVAEVGDQRFVVLAAQLIPAVHQGKPCDKPRSLFLWRAMTVPLEVFERAWDPRTNNARRRDEPPGVQGAHGGQGCNTRGGGSHSWDQHTPPARPAAAAAAAEDADDPWVDM